MNDIKIVRQIITNAINDLLVNDPYLLEKNLNERSITHKLAEHLKKDLHGWDVDCEYNRNAEQVKKIKHLRRTDVSNFDDQGRTVYPDIIIHKRGTDTNWIVLEVKKSNNSSPDSEDIEKIEGYIEELGYCYGVFLRLRVEDSVGIQKIKFFKKDNYGNMIKIDD